MIIFTGISPAEYFLIIINSLIQIYKTKENCQETPINIQFTTAEHGGKQQAKSQNQELQIENFFFFFP